jgi:hypothetical protein
MRDWKRTSFLPLPFVVAIAFLIQPLFAETTPEAPVPSVEERIRESVSYLASDDLEGRGVGTDGLNKAGEYLAERFAALGLNTSPYEGKPFQNFEIITGAKLGETQSITFVPPADASNAQPVELKFQTDFTPLALGGGAKLDMPVVFVGYGITGKDEEYDDYAGVDVNGKAVIVLRHEPQQANPHSPFNGTDDSPFAALSRKVSNAYEHGAAAVIFLTDDYATQQAGKDRVRRIKNNVAELRKAEEVFRGLQTPNENEINAFRDEVAKYSERLEELTGALDGNDDTLLDFRHGGSLNSGRDMPVLHATRAALDPVVFASTGKTLAELEAAIDSGAQPTPQSKELAGWRIQGETQVERVKAQVRNVVAVLEGEGPHADETIVIGAHYDHLGFGGEGSFDPHSEVVHNGADDNASGTAALLEVARQLAARPEKLGRRVVFIAFTGEERGLYGSAHYVKEPLFPLEKTVAMLNMDMVGRLRDKKLIIQGVDTSAEFGPIIDGLNAEYGFELTKQTGGNGPSDHASFYPRDIPVMHFFTDLHDDYHRPSDDTDKVNFDGAAKIAEMVTRTAEAIAKLDARPSYVAVESSAGPTRDRSGSRPYFGSIPDFAQNQEGYALSGVTKGGPAEKAGLLAGDIIIRLGESKIGNLDDFDNALRKFKAGDKAPVTVRRGTEEITVEVELDKPR